MYRKLVVRDHPLLFQHLNINAIDKRKTDRLLLYHDLGIVISVCQKRTSNPLKKEHEMSFMQSC